ncbi:MAG: hypothetical protein LBT98_03860 [Puniceicoccales bacterium]|nr:hypothetical protein [Puniceicoccales bacterium]
MDDIRTLAKIFLEESEYAIYAPEIGEMDSARLDNLKEKISECIGEYINYFENAPEEKAETKEDVVTGNSREQGNIDNAGQGKTPLEWLKSKPIYEKLCKLFRHFFFLANFCPHDKLTKDLHPTFGIGNGAIYKIPGDGNCVLYAMNTLLLAKERKKSVGDFTYDDFKEVCDASAKDRKTLKESTRSSHHGQFGTCLSPSDLIPCARAKGRNIPIIYSDPRCAGNTIYFLCTADGKCQSTIDGNESFDLESFKTAIQDLGGAIFLSNGHARCYVGNAEGISLPITTFTEEESDFTESPDTDMDAELIDLVSESDSKEEKVDNRPGCNSEDMTQ